MRRLGLAGALPVWSWAQTEIVKTADGLSFKFGMIEKFVVLTVQELDFAENFNFTSLTVPDILLGENKLAVHNFANLLFTLEKGPLSIHANLEVEATADEASIDVNNINLERISLTYKIPGLGALTAGEDVHLFDPEGGLVYQDEDAGIWLVGSRGPLSWNLGWHLRSNGLRGASLFTGAGPKGAGGTVFDVSSHIYEARLGYTVVPGTTISPFYLFYNRHMPQVPLNEFSCPVGVCSGFPTFPTDGRGRSDQHRPGMVVTSALGPVTFTGEAAGLLGEIKELSSSFLGGQLQADGTKEFDLRSFALFAELALDGKAIGAPGLTPFVNFEWHKGDGDPFDDKYAGYVPISNLSSALRKDGFNKQSISSFGPPPLGANSEAAWGFDVTGRGIGPTIGAIVPDETGGPVVSAFVNRGGKAGNPGFFKASGGITGKVAPNWDTHFGVSAFWYDERNAILAEAAQNCLARGLTVPGFPACGGLPTSATSVRTVMDQLKSAGFFDDRFMGVEINGNIGYTINNFRGQPFFSVFIPGDVVDDINGAFLSSGTIQPIDSKTAFTAGVEFRASF